MLEKCSHFGLCGGCTFLDLDYTKELKQKENKVRQLFSEFRHVTHRQIIPAVQPHFYRNKVQVPFGKRNVGNKFITILGLFNKESSFIVDQTECKIQDTSLTQIVLATKKWAREEKLLPYNEKTRRGLLKYLVLRKSFATGEILLGLVTHDEIIPYSKEKSKSLHNHIMNLIGKKNSNARLVGIVQNYNPKHTSMALGKDEYTLWGRPYIKEVVGEFHFRVGLSTFVQVNPLQTPTLYNAVALEIPTGAKVIDAFSGIGTTSLWFSKVAKEVVGIEDNPNSFRSALESLKHNRVNSVRFRKGRVQDVLPTLFGKGFDHLVLDPPRIGLGEETCQSINESDVKKIIYVSCDPESLLRDANVLMRKFFLKTLQVVDMFPRTVHMETIAVFIRKD